MVQAVRLNGNERAWSLVTVEIKHKITNIHAPRLWYNIWYVSITWGYTYTPVRDPRAVRVVSDVITDTDCQPIGSAAIRLTCATPEPLASNLLPGENPAGGWHTKTDGVPVRYEMRFYSLRFGALLAFTCLVSVFWIKSTPHDGGKLPMWSAVENHHF